MWIIMKSTYAGELGLFVRDVKYDLPSDVVKKLPKGSFKKIKAPWDEKKAKRKKAKNTMSNEKRDTKHDSRTKQQSSPKDKQFRPEKPGSNYRTK